MAENSSSSPSYSVRTFSPDTFTYQDALRLAEIFVDAFSLDDLHSYGWGPRYNAFTEPFELWKSEGSPMEKLKGYDERIKNHITMLNYYARYFHSLVLTPGEWVYGVFDSNNTLVAIGNWRSPKSMPRPRESFGAMVRRLWYTAKYGIREIILFLKGAHPVYNLRWLNVLNTFKPSLVRIPNTPETQDEFASKTYDDLKETEYPEHMLSYVHIVAVSRGAQRKGLGKLLLKDMIADMPKEAEFRSSDGSKVATGPGKHYLFSSSSGKGMYLKMGYQLLDTIPIEDKESGEHEDTVYLMHCLSV